jgi:hypothetical protein
MGSIWEAAREDLSFFELEFPDLYMHLHPYLKCCVCVAYHVAFRHFSNWGYLICIGTYSHIKNETFPGPGTGPFGTSRFFRNGRIGKWTFNGRITGRFVEI